MGNRLHWDVYVPEDKKIIKNVHQFVHESDGKEAVSDTACARPYHVSDFERK